MKSGEYRISGASHKYSILMGPLLFFMIFQLIPPEGISRVFPLLQRIIWPKYAKVIVYIIVVVVGVSILFLGRRFDHTIIMAVAFPSAAFFLTLVHGLDISGWLKNYSSGIIALLMIQICKHNLIRLIRAVKLYLEILIFINFIFMLLYPRGVYEGETFKLYNWFLGYKSSLQCYMIPCLCLEWLDSFYTKKYVRFIVILLIGVAESILSHNMMLSVAVIILTLFVMLRLYKARVFNSAYRYIVIVILINIMLLFFLTLLSKINIFQSFLLISGKNLTISSRTTVIWPKALQLIADKPIFGHGVYLSKDYISIFGSRAMPHAHNQLLQVLLDGGTFLLVIYFAWQFYLSYRLEQTKDLPSSQIFSVSFFLIMLMATVEVIIYNLLYFAIWLILYLGMYTRDIDRQYHDYVLANLK